MCERLRDLSRLRLVVMALALVEQNDRSIDTTIEYTRLGIVFQPQGQTCDLRRTCFFLCIYRLLLAVLLRPSSKQHTRHVDMSNVHSWNGPVFGWKGER